jgi:hypothetical protein
MPAAPGKTDSRRLPRPFEASVETVRRIQDLNRIRDAVEGVPSSAVLGGSLSYGRFYNVCGAAGKPSDIDLVLIVRSYDELPSVSDRLARLESVSGSQPQVMSDRTEAFQAVRERYERCVFQQKLRLWDGGRPHPHSDRYQIPSYYSLALHVVSFDDLRFVALSDVPRLESSTRAIHEYRDDRPSSGANVLRCFAGYARTFDQETEEVDGGFVTREVVAEASDGRFYPGVHLNLVLPQFEVRWEAPALRIRLSLLDLRWKLLARLADERRLRSFEIQQLSLSHTRGGIFAPHVSRAR